MNAIQEYVNACGETVSNLIRKVLITEATFMNWSHDSHEYDHGISVPDDLDGKIESEMIKATYNKIRKILEMPKLETI